MKILAICFLISFHAFLLKGVIFNRFLTYKISIKNGNMYKNHSKNS